MDALPVGRVDRFVLPEEEGQEGATTWLLSVPTDEQGAQIRNAMAPRVNRITFEERVEEASAIRMALQLCLQGWENFGGVTFDEKTKLDYIPYSAKVKLCNRVLDLMELTEEKKS